MTDLINSYQQGKPISNAQVKNDKKFKIVSQKPVYPSAAQTPTSSTPPTKIGQVENPYYKPRGPGLQTMEMRFSDQKYVTQEQLDRYKKELENPTPPPG